MEGLGGRVTRKLTISVVAAAMMAATATAGLTAETRMDSPSKRWHAADQCNRDAFKKYPDYTQQGAAKREAYVRGCLREHRLPPQNNSGQPKPTGQ
jgi:Ni/Co efflux regulator RcnB